MTTKKRKEIIEEIFSAGMPLQLSAMQVREIFADSENDDGGKDEQVMWLLQCVYAQGRKDGRVEAKHQAIEAIRQISA